MGARHDRALRSGCVVQWLCLGGAEAATYLRSALGDSSCMVGISRGLLQLRGPGWDLVTSSIVEAVWGQDKGTHGGLCVVAGGPLVSTPDPVVPLKFSLPHMAVCFGAGGQLVLVCPHCPAEGQLAHVELHSLEVCHSPAPQTALGPLAGVAPFALRDANAVHHPNSCLSRFPIPCRHLISSQHGPVSLDRASPCLGIASSLWAPHPAPSAT